MNNGADKRRQRTKILIKTHADGFVEVFGDRLELDVHCTNVPFMGTATAHEAQCEEYTDLCIPHRFRDVNFPGMRVAIHMLEEVRAIDIYWREIDLALVAEAKFRRNERRRMVAEQRSTFPDVDKSSEEEITDNV